MKSLFKSTHKERDFELELAGAGVVQQPPLLGEESLEADFFKGLVDVQLCTLMAEYL